VQGGPPPAAVAGAPGRPGQAAVMDGGPMGGFMPQQSQVFVFSTSMANQAAEAVERGLCRTIIDFHVEQPRTRQFLQVSPRASLLVTSSILTNVPMPLPTALLVHVMQSVGCVCLYSGTITFERNALSNCGSPSPYLGQIRRSESYVMMVYGYKSEKIHGMGISGMSAVLHVTRRSKAQRAKKQT